MPQRTNPVASSLKRATARRDASEQAWKDAIRAAHDAGISVRDIAPLAGVSYQRVFQILQGR